MTESEQHLTIAALIVAVGFYVFVGIVYLFARKTRLNSSLATQKLAWALIIMLTLIPGYALQDPLLPGSVRTVGWIVLSVCSGWVGYEVYRENWTGSFASFLRRIRRWVRCHIRRDCER